MNSDIIHTTDTPNGLLSIVKVFGKFAVKVEPYSESQKAEVTLHQTEKEAQVEFSYKKIGLMAEYQQPANWWKTSTDPMTPRFRQ